MNQVWLQVGAKRWLAPEDDALQQIVPEVVDQGQVGYIHEGDCERRTGADECEPYVVHPDLQQSMLPGMDVRGSVNLVLRFDAQYSSEEAKATAEAAIREYMPVLSATLAAMIRRHLVQQFGGPEDRSGLN